jgi:hypothetical protein
MTEDRSRTISWKIVYYMTVGIVHHNTSEIRNLCYSPNIIAVN